MNLWVFDNDGVLYSDKTAGQQFMELLYNYAVQHLHIPVTTVAEVIRILKTKHNTAFSVLALHLEYGADLEELITQTYMRIDPVACGVPSPDHARKAVLQQLPGTKIVLTNNPAAYARRMLTHAGLIGSFSHIIGMEETGLQAKPASAPYQVVEKIYSVYERIIFCDDSLPNVLAAHARGWVGIWLRKETEADSAPSDIWVIENFTDLTSLPLF